MRPSDLHERRVAQLEAELPDFTRREFRAAVCRRLGARLRDGWPCQIVPDGFVFDDDAREIHCYEVGHTVFLADARCNHHAAKKVARYGALARFVAGRSDWRLRVFETAACGSVPWEISL